MSADPNAPIHPPPKQRFSARYTVQRGGTSRFLEDIAFACGLFLIMGKGVIEMGQEAGLLPHREHASAFVPILLEFLRSSLLIVPKMIGRATSGAVWGSIGTGIGKLVGRGKPGTDP